MKRIPYNLASTRELNVCVKCLSDATGQVPERGKVTLQPSG